MTIIADPELDPSATYAVDPARVRKLAARVVAGPRAQTAPTFTPMTGAPIANWPVSTRDDVVVAVDSARSAQRAWGRAPIEARARIMLRFHDLVLSHQVQLLDAIQLEAGKARKHAFEEVIDTAIVARHYARTAAKTLAPRRHTGAIPVLTQSIEHHRPKGVVGIVSPWNYPLSLAITDAIPALMAGNAVVLRPDPQGTLSALLGVELLTRAGLPEGVLQVVVGDGPTTGQAVVDLTDYVCYTGSTATGRNVAQSVAARLTGFSLELGGKNSLYVAADADLGKAVEGAVRGSFSSAGQLCISAERILVHESVAAEFTARFVKAVRKLKIGTSLEYGFDMGSLVNQRQLDRVIAHVEDARALGATVLTGGVSRPDIGPYVYEPTVLTGVTAAMACRDEETFGPVVTIYPVASDEDAIRLANDTAYGLNSAIYTKDIKRGRDIASRIQTGTVNINEPYAAAWASVGSPMGGMKDSGMGRRHGAEGLLKYTESQNVTAQHVLPIAAPRGVSDKVFATVMSVSLRGLKAIGLK